MKKLMLLCLLLPLVSGCYVLKQLAVGPDPEPAEAAESAESDVGFVAIRKTTKDGPQCECSAKRSSLVGLPAGFTVTVASNSIHSGEEGCGCTATYTAPETDSTLQQDQLDFAQGFQQQQLQAQQLQWMQTQTMWNAFIQANSGRLPFAIPQLPVQPAPAEPDTPPQ